MKLINQLFPNSFLESETTPKELRECVQLLGQLVDSETNKIQVKQSKFVTGIGPAKCLEAVSMKKPIRSKTYHAQCSTRKDGGGEIQKSIWSSFQQLLEFSDSVWCSDDISIVLCIQETKSHKSGAMS